MKKTLLTVAAGLLLATGAYAMNTMGTQDGPKCFVECKEACEAKGAKSCEYKSECKNQAADKKSCQATAEKKSCCATK